MLHLNGLELVEDGTGELVGGGLAAHVGSADLAMSLLVDAFFYCRAINLPIGNDGVGGLGDAVSMLIETKVSQQHAAGQKHGSGLHDVGLVDASNLGSAVCEGEREGEPGDTLRLGAGDDLEGLDDTLDALVLKTRVLTLGVLSDDAQVDVLVAGLVAGDVLDQADAGVNVELLSHGDVEALVAGSADGGVEDTLEAELVALERSDGLAEGILSAAGALETGNLDLLPLNGDVVGLEDGLDRLGNLGTDTITGDEGDGVLAAVLGRLEDVGLDGGEGSGELGLLLGDAAQQLSRVSDMVN
ncbi:unnamed protein product [Fusarium graminearum]|nr:unnamed protein product [Fusarium graminearum]